MIWKTEAKFQALFNLPTSPNYSVTNNGKSAVFHCFEKIELVQFK